MGGKKADWRVRLAVPMFAVIVALGGLALWGWLRPPPEPPVIRYVMESPSAGGPLGLALSPDGTRMAYVGSDSALQSQVYVRERDGFDPTQFLVRVDP